MIKICNLNKFYNKGKTNELHVINDVSMELPQNGIVSLLGPSGSGKTTLLNLLGGLDKADSGEIFIDEKPLSQISNNQLDSLRNINIGYIFQNYNLINNYTASENISITLKMLGIHDADLVKARVDYCLNQVGLYKFRNKKVCELSGGQQQRVAIARALAKNPEYIIADEPTGNLDTSNTIQIMNLIKTISKDKLVVLVTHERTIADFYSDYIYEIQDGQIISHKENDSSNYQNFLFENKIFLKDLPQIADFSGQNSNIKIFGDKKKQAHINIVLRNESLIIDSAEKFQIIDGSSDIEMVDEHKKIENDKEGTQEFAYDKFLPQNFTPKSTSVDNFSHLVRGALARINSMKKTKKLLLLTFAFAAISTFVSVCNILGTSTIEPQDYLKTNPHYLSISNLKQNDEILDIGSRIKDIKYVIPGDSKISVGLPLMDYFQTFNVKKRLNVSVADTSVLRRWDVILGSLPITNKDVVLDKMVFENFLKTGQGQIVNLNTIDQMLGRKILINRVGEYNISGICDLGSPSMYVNNAEMMGILSYAGVPLIDDGIDSSYGGIDETIYDDSEDSPEISVVDVKYAKSELRVIDGRMPQNTYEVIVSSLDSDIYSLGKTIDDIEILGHPVYVSGIYSSAEEDYTIYSNEETARLAYLSEQNVCSAYCSNPKLVQETLGEFGISSKIAASAEKQKYTNSIKGYMRASILVCFVVILLSLVAIFIVLRASLLSRINEVSVLRAIGLRKFEIYKMFIVEILLLTFITAIPGIAISNYFLYYLIHISGFFGKIFVLKPIAAFSTIIVLVIFNSIAGLLPVAKLMSKTPAELIKAEFS